MITLYQSYEYKSSLDGNGSVRKNKNCNVNWFVYFTDNYFWMNNKEKAGRQSITEDMKI